MKICLLLVTLFVSSTTWATACPTTAGESTPCEKEQKAVEKAMKNLTPAYMFKYCGVNGTKPLACRAIVRYKNNKGVLSEDIFEEWFISSPDLSGQTIYRGFFVKNNKGTFDNYWHDVFVGTVMDPFTINYAIPEQENVVVGFSGLFVNFEIHYESTTGAPPTRALMSYDVNTSVVQKYNAGTSALTEKLLYPLSSIQMF